MPKLTYEEILHVAELARIEIPERIRNTLERQFNEILEYVEKLKELKTEGIEPTTQVIAEGGLHSPLAEDSPRPSFGKDEVVANAPERQDQFFKVPRMIGDET